MTTYSGIYCASPNRRRTCGDVSNRCGAVRDALVNRCEAQPPIEAERGCVVGRDLSRGCGDPYGAHWRRVRITVHSRRISVRRFGLRAAVCRAVPVDDTLEHRDYTMLDVWKLIRERNIEARPVFEPRHGNHVARRLGRATDGRMTRLVLGQGRGQPRDWVRGPSCRAWLFDQRSRSRDVRSESILGSFLSIEWRGWLDSNQRPAD